MKIVLPVHHFPPTYSAGAELYTFRLARRLQSAGCDIEVVSVESINQGQRDELTADNDSYQDIPVWRLSYNVFATPDKLLWDFDNPLLDSWFREYFTRSRPDLVHFQAGYLLGVAPIRAAAQASIPAILTLHDFWFLCPRHTLQRSNGSLCDTVPADPSACAWCRCAERPIYQTLDSVTGGIASTIARKTLLRTESTIQRQRRATLADTLGLLDHVIAPSRFLAQRFAGLVKPERLTVLPLGIDLDPFRNLERNQHTDTLRIGYTGQIAHHKGVHLLVEAFRQLPNQGEPVELHIHGGLESNPIYVDRLRKLIDNDPRISLHGRYEHRMLPIILANLDAIVVPSIWYENSPLAILEAHAAGTPVLTASMGGMAELVRHEVDGLHFAFGSSADLARMLQRLRTERGLLVQLQNGVQPPRSLDDETRGILELYSTLTAHSITSTIMEN